MMMLRPIERSGDDSDDGDRAIIQHNKIQCNIVILTVGPVSVTLMLSHT